jgi:plastocyanin
MPRVGTDLDERNGDFMKAFSSGCLRVAAAAAGLCAGAAGAATVVVEMGGGGFDSYSPADIVVDVGDTVQWVWVMGFHNVESGTRGRFDGSFTSGDPLESDGLTFSVTFDQAFLDAHPVPGNVYDYYCIIHWFFGMTGTVTVKQAPACPADFDRSGTVNGLDLAALLAQWTGAATYPACPPPAPTDLNGDCRVNGLDLATLLAAWGDCR